MSIGSEWTALALLARPQFYLRVKAALKARAVKGRGRSLQTAREGAEQQGPNSSERAMQQRRTRIAPQDRLEEIGTLTPGAPPKPPLGPPSYTAPPNFSNRGLGVPGGVAWSSHVGDTKSIDQDSPLASSIP